MAVKFCKQAGCHEVAIGAARSRDYCREDYNREILDKVELVRFEVTAERGRVTDARTQVSHGRGGVVELDPAETNVAALVAAGLGRVVTAAKPTPASSSSAAKG